MRFVSGLSVSGLLLLALIAIPGVSQQDKTEKTGPEAAALKELEKQAADPKADPDKLWGELLAFQRKYPGTPHAVRAAELLSQLPSPLDKLDRNQIPPEDRLPWLPAEVVAVLGEHRGRHWGYVSSVGVTANGKLVFSSSETTRVWNAETMHERAVLKGDLLGMLADGRTLVTRVDDELRMWDVSGDRPNEGTTLNLTPRGAKVRTIPRLVTLARDGKTLATVTEEDGYRDTIYAVRLWDVTADRVVERGVVKEDENEVYKLVLSPDGKSLALIDDPRRRNVRIWDLSADKPKVRATVKNLKEPLAFAPDGKTLVGFYPDEHGVWLLDVARPEIEIRLRRGLGGERHLSTVAFSPDGRLLAGADEHSQFLWLVRLDEKRHEELGLPAGETIVTIPLTFSVSVVTFAPDGKTLVLGCVDGTVRLWDLAQSRERFPLRASTAFIGSAALILDGRTLATGGPDQFIRLWDLANGALKQRAAFRENYTRGPGWLASSQDGKFLASLGTFGRQNERQYALRLWDLSETPKERASIPKLHDSELYSFAMAPDWQTFASVGQDQFGVRQLDEQDAIPLFWKTIRLWDVTAPRPKVRYTIRLGEQPKHPTDLTDIAGLTFASDGKTLGFIHEHHDVHLWDVGGAAPKQVTILKGELRGRKRFVDRLAFSPDGKTLAAVGYDEAQQERGLKQSCVLCLWELRDGRANERATWKVDGSCSFNWLGFAPNGKYVGAVTSDNRLLLWEATSGETMRSWQMGGRIRSLGFCADSRHLATVNGNGTVYLLRMNSPLRGSVK